MAKNAKELGQVKARQTKLGKKSAEELIQIILRKDATERKLNSNIISLKAEVNSLTSRVNNFDKDQEGNIKAIENLKLEVEKKKEHINNLNDIISSKSAKVEELKEVVKEKDNAIKVYKIVCVVLGFAILASILCMF